LASANVSKLKIFLEAAAYSRVVEFHAFVILALHAFVILGLVPRTQAFWACQRK
jgi:hypothetical protein